MKSRSSRYHGRPEQDRLVRAIESARVKAGLSQRELSRRLGLHEMTLMRFENGDRMLDVLEMIDIAHALGLSPYDLLRASNKTRSALDEPTPTLPSPKGKEPGSPPCGGTPQGGRDVLLDALKAALAED